jgi:SAM-dependent methyltransferase
MKSILETPQVYVAFQRLVGGARMREICLEMLAPQAGERILDVGCGPAYYLGDLPKVEYYGFDTDQRYIEHARSRFGDRATFFAEEYTRAHAERLGKFDGILLMGLLHHLDDATAHELLAVAADSLKPGGRVVALDTTVHSGQSWWEHRFALGDRGQFVRTPEAFTALARAHFGEVGGQLRPEGSWVPDCHWIMTLRSPHTRP